MDTLKLIDKVNESNGSELYLKAGSQPLMRLGKLLKKIDTPAIQSEDMEQLISEFLSADEQNRFAKLGSFESNYFGKASCNFRLTLLHSQQRPIAIIKLISNRIPTLEEIGFPKPLYPMMEAKKGIFIMAGPIYSGISTTFASFIEAMNQTIQKHILVIEDPIEFNFVPNKCAISQRQFNRDFLSLGQGINFAKRMDLDVLAIADIKNELPFKMILEYAAGGHFVILSMHTLGIVATLEKILLSFSEHDRDYVCHTLSESLLGIFAQVLLPDLLGKNFVAAQEVLTLNNTIRSIIQKGKISQIEPNIASAGAGSYLFAQHMPRLVMEQKIDRNAANNFLEQYKEMRG